MVDFELPVHQEHEEHVEDSEYEEDELAGFAIDSSIWDSGTFSQVLIIPFLDTEEQLQIMRKSVYLDGELVGDEYFNAEDCVEDLVNDIEIARTIRQNLLIKADEVMAAVEQRVAASADSVPENLDAEQYDVPAMTLLLSKTQEGLENLQTTFAAAIEVQNVAAEMVRQFSTIRKVVDVLLAVVEEHRHNYKGSLLALKRITICIKCLDALWPDLRVIWRLWEEAYGKFWLLEKKSFPFEELNEYAG